MNLRKYLFTSSVITIIAILFVLFIAAGCAVILQKQVDLKKQSQPNPISSVDTTNWQTYRNEKYGFEVPLTDAWKGFKVETDIVGVEKDIENIVFLVPYTCPPNIDKCYQWISPFYIQVFSITGWEKLRQERNIKEPLIIEQNSDHFFTLRQDDLPKDIKVDFEVSKVISTFKFIEPVVASTPEKLFTIESTGGRCTYGLCSRKDTLYRDGSFTREDGSTTTPITTQLNQANMEVVTRLIDTADFETINLRKFTGICPIAYDGQEYIYTFYVGSDIEVVDSCKTMIDYNYDLFTAINNTIQVASSRMEE
ncbi:MAG: hypothetical protein V1712_00750 [Patescibacteria group bacterium]